MGRPSTGRERDSRAPGGCLRPWCPLQSCSGVSGPDSDLLHQTARPWISQRLPACTRKLSPCQPTSPQTVKSQPTPSSIVFGFFQASSRILNLHPAFLQPSTASSVTGQTDPPPVPPLNSCASATPKTPDISTAKNFARLTGRHAAKSLFTLHTVPALPTPKDHTQARHAAQRCLCISTIRTPSSDTLPRSSCVRFA